jgi:Domain of unknown function (DUF4190)
MKKCPTCNKTFEDSMRFCQTDGTPLVDDEPAFDPFATIMARPGEFVVPPTEETPPAEEASVMSDVTPEPVSSSSITLEPAAEPTPEPIAEPDNVLDLPSTGDPLKTMYVSDAEMQAALGSPADEAKTDEPPQPEPPVFSVPDLPAPSFGSLSPPPSPFSPSDEGADEPSTPSPMFEETPTMIQPAMSTPFDEPSSPAAEWNPTPPAAPVAEWTPPPAPDASWQNQEIGSNTPFQPPMAGAEQSKGLAVGSLVCGILSFTICGSMGLFLGPLAIVMGFIAKKRAGENPTEYAGSGLALGGIITGAIGLLVGLMVIVFLFYFGAWGNLFR